MPEVQKIIDDLHGHVDGLLKYVVELQERADRWEAAFYREERRAVGYHNEDASCGHPASCIRNTGDGAKCLMCVQDEEIKCLRASVDQLEEIVDGGD